MIEIAVFIKVLVNLFPTQWQYLFSICFSSNAIMSRLTRQYTVLRPPCSFRFRPPIHFNSACVCTFNIYATETKNNLITSEYTYILAMITYGSVGDKQSIPKAYAEFPILNEICFSMMQFSCSTFKSPWNIFSKCLTPKGSNPPYLSLKTAPFLSSREDGWRWDQTFNSLLLISRRHANIENLYQSYIPNMDTISNDNETWKLKSCPWGYLGGANSFNEVTDGSTVWSPHSTSDLSDENQRSVFNFNTVFFVTWPIWAYGLTLSGYNFKTKGQSPKPNTFSESWVREDSVGTSPEKFLRWKFLGTVRFTKKITFSPIFVSGWKKSIEAVCAQFWCHRPST